MAFAAARMILKDKRRKPSKEEYAPRNRSKVTSHNPIHCLYIVRVCGCVYKYILTYTISILPYFSYSLFSPLYEAFHVNCRSARRVSPKSF